MRKRGRPCRSNTGDGEISLVSGKHMGKIKAASKQSKLKKLSEQLKRKM